MRTVQNARGEVKSEGQGVVAVREFLEELEKKFTSRNPFYLKSVKRGFSVPLESKVPNEGGYFSPGGMLTRRKTQIDRIFRETLISSKIWMRKNGVLNRNTSSPPRASHLLCYMYNVHACCSHLHSNLFVYVAEYVTTILRCFIEIRFYQNSLLIFSLSMGEKKSLFFKILMLL